MKKTILSLITIAFISFAFAPSATATGLAEMPAVESELAPISVTVDRNNIVIKNAEGQLLQIYDITGELVFSQHLDVNSKSIEKSTFQKGCYIVKIGKFTRKIIIK